MTERQGSNMQFAIEHLERLKCGPFVLADAASALRFIAAAAFTMEPADPAEIAMASGMLSDATALVADAAAGTISAEHIYFGLGCASAIAKCQDPRRKGLLVEYALVLEADLKALALRRDITLRGDPDLVEMIRRYSGTAASVFPPVEQPVLH